MALFSVWGLSTSEGWKAESTLEPPSGIDRDDGIYKDEKNPKKISNNISNDNCDGDIVYSSCTCDLSFSISFFPRGFWEKFSV